MSLRSSITGITIILVISELLLRNPHIIGAVAFRSNDTMDKMLDVYPRALEPLACRKRIVEKCEHHL
jgi:hypothetical protein